MVVDWSEKGARSSGPWPVSTSRFRSNPPAVAVSAENRWYHRLPSTGGRNVSTQILNAGSCFVVWSPDLSSELTRP